MPELPEVETIVRQLDRTLKGKVIKTVEVLKKRSFVGDEKELRGKMIMSVERVAKMLIIRFVEFEKVLVIHLKMTGQLIWRPDNWMDKRDFSKEVVGGHPSTDWIGKLPSSHTRVVVQFEDKSSLFFNDMRIFGWMKLMSQEELKLMTDELPPDVTDKKRFTFEYFRSLCVRTKKSIKLLVMDSAKIGGAGNIYANDALWVAKIDPHRPASSLSEEEMIELYQAVKMVINEGIRYGGATYSDFVGADGLGGKYQEHFRTYKRDGKPCLECGELIKKGKIGGRGTFWCGRCQK